MQTIKINTKKLKTQAARQNRVYLEPSILKGKRFKNRIKEHLVFRGYKDGRLHTDAMGKIGCTPVEFTEWLNNERQPRIDQLISLSILISEPVQNLYSFNH